MTKTSLTTACCCLLIAAGSAIAVRAQATGFQSGPTHAGTFDGVAAPQPAGLRWRVQTAGPVRGSPVVQGDVVFVGSGDGTVTAVGLQHGEVRWRRALGGPVSSSPAVAAGTVFVHDGAGVLWALDARSGDVRWRYASGAAVPLAWGLESGLVFDSSPTVGGALVLLAGRDGKVHAVDVRTGRARWTADLGSRLYSSPAISDGIVVVGSQHGVVTALALADGAVKWRFATLGNSLHSADFGFDRTTVQSSPSVADGSVYVGARDGLLYALDLATGRERWRFDHKVSWVNSTPAVSDGVVYAASSDAHFVQAVDAATGAERWRFATQNIVWASPLVDRELVYVGEGDGTFYAIDKRTGRERWRWRAGARIVSSAAAASGTVIVGSDDGAAYAIAGGPAAMQRAVYWDSASIGQPMAVARPALRNWLVDRGYRSLTAQGLADFLEQRVRDHVPSAVVFAIDHVPATVAPVAADTVLMRRYLDAGGTVVWCGAPPLIAPATMQGLKDLVRDAPRRLLGVDFSLANFDPLGVKRSDGRAAALGFPEWWLDSWGVDARSVTEVLARNEFGQATAWRKQYGGPAGTGFVRVPCHDGSAGRPFMHGAVQAAAEWRGLPDR